MKTDSLHIKVIYDNNKDKELLEKINLEVPIFIDFIDFNSPKGRKEAYKIKSYYGAKLNPFIQVEDSEYKVVKVFYSESGNSINQLIKWLNEK